MDELRLETLEGVTLRRELAGGGSRFGAALVDLCLLGIGYLALCLAFLVFARLDVTGASGLVRGVLIGGLPLSIVLYQLGFLAATGGRTPGKRLFGLRVVADDGYPTRGLQLVLRSVLLPLDALTVPVPIGILAIQFGAHRQRLGDLVAGTVVVRERRVWRRSEPFPNETWSTLPARTANLVPGLAARLDDEDYELLRELLSRQGLAPAERRRLYVEIARYYSKRLDLGAFEDARVVLKELFLFLREARTSRSAAPQHGL